MEKILYPKTTRIQNEQIVITEKLDWSNLWIFKLNWELIIAQRNHVFKKSELTKLVAYKWLIWWLEENESKLDLHEWSWVFWEWIWMWQISYEFDKRFYIFAKANIDEEYNIRNIKYDHKLLHFPFESGKVPDCIWYVPIVETTNQYVDIDYLNNLYDIYSNNKGRKVEWFIIINSWTITKYVRFKNGKQTEHKTAWE